MITLKEQGEARNQSPDLVCSSRPSPWCWQMIVRRFMSLWVVIATIVSWFTGGPYSAILIMCVVDFTNDSKCFSAPNPSTTIFLTINSSSVNPRVNFHAISLTHSHQIIRHRKKKLLLKSFYNLNHKAEIDKIVNSNHDFHRRKIIKQLASELSSLNIKSNFTQESLNLKAWLSIFYTIK